MKNRVLKILLPTILFVSIFVLWEITSKTGIINSVLFSSPTNIVKQLITHTQLKNHIIQSIYRLIASVIIGFPLGVLIGLIISTIKKVNFVEDIAAFFMSIPGISWAPIFIMLIGFGNPTIITVGILTAFFPGLYNTIHGIKAIDKNLIKVTEMLEYSSISKFYKVTLPAISNYTLLGLKEAVSRAWRTIIAVEMIAATMFGIGYMTYDARELINSSVMFLGILVSGIIYLLIEQILIGAVEKQTVKRWGMKEAHD